MILKKFNKTINEKILLEKATLNLSKDVLLAIKKIFKTINNGGKVDHPVIPTFHVKLLDVIIPLVFWFKDLKSE